MRSGAVFSSCAFQLTTSRGGRLLDFIIIASVHFYFNSRPHKEVDNLSEPKTNIENISTHDLTRRSTIIGDNVYGWVNISTHDLTRRSTAFEKEQVVAYAFQLTTSRGGRPWLRKYVKTLKGFQLTTSRGGRHMYAAGIWNCGIISTHDLARRSTFI